MAPPPQGAYITIVNQGAESPSETAQLNLNRLIIIWLIVSFQLLQKCHKIGFLTFL